MPLPRLPFSILSTTKQLISGLHINNLNYLLTGFTTGITATAGGTQATSLALSSFGNEVTVVATANDGVILPPAKSGLRLGVINSDGADSLQIFANGTDTINATAGNVGVALAAGACAYFVCFKDGNWRRFVSA